MNASRRRFFALAAAVVGSAFVSMPAAAPRVEVKLPGVDWFEVPMLDTVERTVANYSNGWSDGKGNALRASVRVIHGEVE